MSRAWRASDPPLWLSYGYLAVAMFGVGTYVALSKPLNAALPVFLLGWLRFGIAGVATLRWLRKPKSEAVLSWRIRGLLFLSAFIGSFLFTIFMVLGVSRSGAVAAGVILSAIPAMVAVLSWALLHESIRPRVIVAIVLGVLGIALLALAGPASPGASGNWLGYLLLGATVLCEGCYVVIGKQLTAVLSSKRICALVNLWGFVLMLPAGVWIARDFDFAAVSVSSWLLLVFYAMSASVWTMWLWMTGLRRVPASRAGVFTVMLPVGSACTGVAFLGESFSLQHALAFALALAGLLLAAWPARARS
ncbi:MAG TPA: DMT family transporter [Castellaniella sp.]|uniref:DMT family transporter n=1 Tax=Castellaniella sp. TaxID=1955812 RepID=UPI002EDC0A49